MGSGVIDGGAVPGDGGAATESGVVEPTMLASSPLGAVLRTASRFEQLSPVIESPRSYGVMMPLVPMLDPAPSLTALECECAAPSWRMCESCQGYRQECSACKRGTSKNMPLWLTPCTPFCWMKR